MARAATSPPVSLTHRTDRTSEFWIGGTPPGRYNRPRKDYVMTETVGFIGLGAMGRPMALNLRKAGIPLVVHSRSRGPVDALVAAGAEAADSPAAVAAACRRIITVLPDGPDVAQVLEGGRGVFSALQPDTLLVDSSTIQPAIARRLAARAAELGASMLDAPVSGGEIGAIDGTLAFMVGGDAAALEAVRPLLDIMGTPEKVVHVGPSGAGQVTKACNQLVIGGTMAVVAEAIALARKSGVDPAKVRQALLGGFAQSRVLDVHGERMIQGNYKPGFKGRLYVKDMGIAAGALAEHGIPAPVTALVSQLVQAQATAGRGEMDYSAVATILFDLAGLDWSGPSGT
ncbi:MAG: NAD(P)-dependent oxidoreductase [Vicinamibacterales bacterium]